MDEYQKILHKHIKNSKIPPSEKIEIKTLSELKKLIERLKPTNSQSSSLTVNFEKVEMPNGQVISKLPVSMKSDGESMERRILIDGFELVKRQQEYKKAAMIYEEDIDSFGGFFPAIPAEGESSVTWIDRFIKDHLDGKRDGLFVVWDVTEGTYKLDPWSCKLEKIDAPTT